MEKIATALSKTLPIFLIRLYQRIISPFFGQCCRFYPSCSNYVMESIQSHGFFYGMWLGCKRLLRCHPFSKGGHDPVPTSCLIYHSSNKRAKNNACEPH